MKTRFHAACMRCIEGTNATWQEMHGFCGPRGKMDLRAQVGGRNQKSDGAGALEFPGDPTVVRPRINWSAQ